MKHHQKPIFLKNHSFLDRNQGLYITEGSERGRQRLNRSRLATLKDYSTWDRTKPYRLQIENIKDIDKQPLLQVALTCGFKNNSNQVLNDMVQRHIDKEDEATDPEELNQFKKILQDHQTHGYKDPKKHLSFIQYKTNSEAKEKIGRMLSPQKERVELKFKTPLTSFVRKDQVAANPPKELKDLKKRLKSLPSVGKSQRKSLPIIVDPCKATLDTGDEIKEYSEDLRDLIEVFRREQAIEEKKNQDEAIQQQKRDVLYRYQYKLNVERDTFRRNVKSYLKCIQDYRNERKRQQVRANGIKRFKRISMIERVKNLLQEQAEAKARSLQNQPESTE